MAPRIKIFAVDDNRDFLDALKVFFDHNNVEDYELFESAEEAIKALTPEVYICIVDFTLDAKINGLELIEVVSKINDHCWFIMLSGLVPGPQREKVLMKFMNISHGSRFIEKALTDTYTILLSTINEIKNHINIIASFYKNQGEIMDELSKIKNV